MTAIIRPFGHLKTFFNDQAAINVEAGRSVRETLVMLKIQPEVIAGVFVNDVPQTKEYILQEEDDVRLFAVMGGG